MGDRWKEFTIGELGRVVTGKTPPTADPENYGGTLPFITPSDMKIQKYIDHTERTISIKGIKHVKNLLLPPRTVFVSCIGSDMGKVGMTRIESVTNQQINSIIVKEGIEPDYVYYSLYPRKDELQRLATSGSAQPILNKGHFAQLKINLPPLEEQRAIAAILGALDDKIELTRRMNETLEAMARALFKSWFVDFDPVRLRRGGSMWPPEKGIPTQGCSYMPPEILALFPNSFEDSPLGKIPKGWKVGKVSELASLSREGLSPSEYPDEVFDHYSIPSFDEWRFPKAETGEQIKSNKLFVPAEAVLLSKLNPRFPRVWLPAISHTRRSACSTEFLVALPKAGTTREYLYALFSSDSFLDVFSTLVTGTSSSHQRVKAEYLLAMDILIPDSASILSFTAAVRPLLQQVASNLVQSRTLAAIRDALLPKLLSGEIQVKDAEKLG